MHQRLISGSLLGALFLLAAFFMPAILAGPLILLVALSAQWEFYRLLDAVGIPSYRFVGMLSGFLLIGVTFLGFMMPMQSWSVWEMESCVLFLTIFVVCVRTFPQKNNTQPLNTIACTLLGVLYVPFLFNFITKLLFHWGTPGWCERIVPSGRWFLLYLVIVVKMTDVGAYFVGRAMGKHKMFPRISPGKSWEGLAGGLIAGAISSVVIFYLLRVEVDGQWYIGAVPFGWISAVTLGLLLAGVGVLGDLVESLLKRAVGAKDASAMIPGMGGLLDVLDSLLLGAPFLYFYLRLITVL